MIVTVANHKGGVGKTAVAAHLVFRAAESGRVLAVDLDAQGNLSSTLVPRSEMVGQPASELLFSGDRQPRPMATGIHNVDLLPAAAALNNTDRLNLSAGLQARSFLRDYGAEYDVVVIDCAPALGLRLTAALSSSTRVVVPLIPEAYAVDGVASLLGEATAIQEHLNPQLKPADFVLNMVMKQAKSHQRTAARLAGMVNLRQPWLHRRIAVADALADRRPVWRGGNSAAAAQEWRELCDALLADFYARAG
ncbi:ParA family protein [Pseudomarimonas salicorniae]|uniref:ParA family protein n=1 Tax=Pseudomarimonas salicorniae TaxID=2933270 RepID=A0ABT0GH85_9GAMM|nr:ParA family protein [Lysobacter sp. CAU 1642]MCK7593904.1 ParA family protein [Lysobacter sp. CAU 1642]